MSADAAREAAATNTGEPSAAGGLEEDDRGVVAVGDLGDRGGRIGCCDEHRLRVDTGRLRRLRR